MVSKCPAGSTDCLTKAKRARTSINLEMKLVILRQHTGGEGMNAFVCLLDLAQSSVSIVLKNTASEKQVKLALCSWQRQPPHLLTTLRCISRACPDNPMVLEQVNLYLHSLEHGGPALERAVMWMRSAESDSGQESSDECPGPTNASCTLRTTGKMEVLMRCLSLLVAMLDYPAHTWDLQRWQKLTQVLTKFYQAWVQTDGSAASAQLPSAKTAAPPADAKMSTLMVDNDEAANQLLKKKLEIELKLMEN
ncbi:uncharacterized protein LOC135090064 isoform X2 [Scylla paramamosain]|uniref:uncharacterized protein LOC135090064 isoform X2 n=1 Tax=Scylla paramamosain TaxID=85552 RepID=UPI003083992F